MDILRLEFVEKYYWEMKRASKEQNSIIIVRLLVGLDPKIEIFLQSKLRVEFKMK